MFSGEWIAVAKEEEKDGVIGNLCSSMRLQEEGKRKKHVGEYTKHKEKCTYRSDREG